MMQRTLILMKPDAVQRGIVGEILSRFERAGLKIVASKFILADKDLVAKHYNKDDAWKEKVGKLGIKDAEANDLDIEELYGTKDPVKIGDIINQSSLEYITMGPVFGFVLEGVNAVAKVRKLVGNTFSAEAEPGTIRGDYGMESPLTGLIKKRVTYNMIHASGAVDEAKDEIKMWFDESEILTYRRAHDDIYKY